MLFIPDVLIAALASYVAYKTLQAWRGLSEARLSLHRHGTPGRLARAGGRGGHLSQLADWHGDHEEGARGPSSGWPFSY